MRISDWSSDVCSSDLGSPVKAYLGSRHIPDLAGCDALRFHPRCYYRASEDDAPDVRPAWAATLAAVTDLGGAVTGVHRPWPALAGRDRAPVASPLRAMGPPPGNGVRSGCAVPSKVPRT